MMLPSPLNPFASQTSAAGEPQASAAAKAVTAVTGVSRELKKNRHNPFMAALDTNSEEFKSTYGQNIPLEKPMFLGYRDDVALYGGGRLFVLY